MDLRVEQIRKRLGGSVIALVVRSSNGEQFGLDAEEK